MGVVIIKVLDMVEEWKCEYCVNGILYYCLWIFLIIDGVLIDEWQVVVNKVFWGEEDKRFVFFFIGVQGVDMKMLV